MNNQRAGPLRILEFSEILKEFGFTSDQIEFMWESRPFELDEETLRKSALVLSAFLTESNKSYKKFIIKRTREGERRLLKSRFQKKLKNLK